MIWVIGFAHLHYKQVYSGSNAGWCVNHWVPSQVSDSFSIALATCHVPMVMMTMCCAAPVPIPRRMACGFMSVHFHLMFLLHGGGGGAWRRAAWAFLPVCRGGAMRCVVGKT